MKLINKLLSKISLSILSDNTHSTSRLQSYIVLIPVLLMTLIFISIEIFSIVNSIINSTEYIISNEILIVYGMLLSHHLALVFSRRDTITTDINTITESENEEDIEE